MMRVISVEAKIFHSKSNVSDDCESNFHPIVHRFVVIGNFIGFGVRREPRRRAEDYSSLGGIINFRGNQAARS